MQQKEVDSEGITQHGFGVLEGQVSSRSGDGIWLSFYILSSAVGLPSPLPGIPTPQHSKIQCHHLL